MYKFLAFVFCLFFSLTVWAQDFDETIRMFQSTRWRLEQEAQERPVFRSTWEGRGSWLALRMPMRIGQDAFLELSPEQNEKFAFLRKDNEIAVEWFQKKNDEQDPEFLAAVQAIRAAVPENDPNFENATEEQRKAYVEAGSVHIDMWLHDVQREIEENLTPEQMQKVRALELLLLPELGLPNPAMFEPLGLSDEQKEQMAAIKKEMGAEFEKLLDEFMAVRREHFKQMGEFLDEEYKDKKPVSHQEIFEAMLKTKQSDALVEMFKNNAERGQKFATLLKVRLMNVLTDEQLDRMQKLIDDAPDFIKEILAAMKRERETKEKSENWTPGPDSWRPGDGTPEEFKRKRKVGKEFPQEEKP